MKEVLCCCTPENVMGALPADSTALQLRETTDGEMLFSSGHRSLEELRRIPGFMERGVAKKKPRRWG